jgi:carbamoyl-phosphate synthase large subunit
MSKSILITGVGAIIGQGILKSLRKSNPECRLIAVDSNPYAVGKKWADNFYCVPRTENSEWLSSIVTICNKECIDLVLIGIEQDLKAFQKTKRLFEKQCGAFLLLNTPQALSLGLDKWDLYTFAQKHDILMPPTMLLNDSLISSLSSKNCPLLLKPRKGMASKGIYRVDTIEALPHFLLLIKKDDYILQKYIGSDSEEFTVGVFGSKDNMISTSFALRRTLNYGSTFEAQTVFDVELDKVVNEIAQKIQIVGPTNFQFRKMNEGYCLIEINPRFSSSTSIRAAFGFNEAHIAVEHLLYGKWPVPVTLHSGRCSRYIEDCVVFE